MEVPYELQEERLSKFAWCAEIAELAQPCPPQRYVVDELCAGYRLAAIALARQIVAHLPTQTEDEPMTIRYTAGEVEYTDGPEVEQVDDDGALRF